MSDIKSGQVFFTSPIFFNSKCKRGQDLLSYVISQCPELADGVLFSFLSSNYMNSDFYCFFASIIFCVNCYVFINIKQHFILELIVS